MGLSADQGRCRVTVCGWNTQDAKCSLCVCLISSAVALALMLQHKVRTSISTSHFTSDGMSMDIYS